MPETEPAWLNASEVVELNRREVEETSECHAVRDHGAIERGIHRAVWHWTYGEGDIGKLATVLIGGLAQNHPFEQGNKRTAWMAGLVFAERNGYIFNAPDLEFIGQYVHGLTTHDISEDHFADWLNAFLKDDTASC